MSIKHLFNLFAIVLGTVSIALGVMTFLTLTNQEQIVKSQEIRYQSYVRADELRQSSDDLTRLARTYALTGDSAYEEQYWEILDIRNGKKPRPINYERIYWDFVAADGKKPRGSGETIALQDMMKQLGFTDAEFAKLQEAADNSDALVMAETIAMNAVKGLFEDGEGNFTKKGEPDLVTARELMHSKDYHVEKAKIMAPINDFLGMLDTRTQEKVALHIKQGYPYLIAVMVLNGILILFGGWFFWAFKRYVQRPLGDEPMIIETITKKVSTGDLSVEFQKKGQATGVYAAMIAMVTNLGKIVSQVIESYHSIQTSAKEIAIGNKDLSQRTTTQASALEETAATMELFTATAKQNAENANYANKLGSSARQEADKGSQVVANAINAMGEINQSSKKIESIISVIDEIAFQTNLLALNAAVEAARAGEQGRGFAVVAGEVRLLAQRSADSAKEISALIKDSIDKVDEGSRLVDESGKVFEGITSEITKVSDLVSEIAAANSEQSSSIEQVNKAITQMDNSTQQNAALVEQSAAASRSMEEQVGGLQEVMAFFKLKK